MSESVTTAEDVRAALSGKKKEKGVKKEKTPRVPKVKAEKAPLPGTLPDDAVIHFAEKDGKMIGPNNMPCHEGTKRYARFSIVYDGMTVAAAAEAGLPNHQIRQYVQRGWVVTEGGTPVVEEDEEAA
jgi:hypothetical protein